MRLSLDTEWANDAVREFVSLIDLHFEWNQQSWIKLHHAGVNAEALRWAFGSSIGSTKR